MGPFRNFLSKALFLRPYFRSPLPETLLPRTKFPRLYSWGSTHRGSVPEIPNPSSRSRHLILQIPLSRSYPRNFAPKVSTSKFRSWDFILRFHSQGLIPKILTLKVSIPGVLVPKVFRPQSPFSKGSCPHYPLQTGLIQRSLDPQAFPPSVSLLFLRRRLLPSLPLFQPRRLSPNLYVIKPSHRD